MAQTVIGFFDDASEAQQAVEKLQSAGISRDKVDVSRGGSGSSSGASASGNTVANPVSGSPKDDNSVSRTADDRTIDGEGRNTNVFTDFFNNLFGGSDNNDDADRYSKVAQGSNTMVTVHAQSNDEAERAADILDDCGAVDVDERAAQYSGASAGQWQRTENTDETTIQSVEESLNLGKRTGETGGARMRSRIVDRPVEEHVRLREEHINVGRQPMNNPFSSSDTHAFDEQNIVEDSRLSNDYTERDETIRDNVRNTDVDMDSNDQGTRRSDTDFNRGL